MCLWVDVVFNLSTWLTYFSAQMLNYRSREVQHSLQLTRSPNDCVQHRSLLGWGEAMH